MTKSKQSPKQRIMRIQKFLLERGINKESVNKVQRNILESLTCNKSISA